ncbi:MAG: hypothetical protein JO170_27555, partial [Verrucomicrobia bacterium]|nr:hypothetical protein [Verrucomicrobiota bacterium]
KLTEALDTYRQELSVIKPLAEEDKTNAGWQRDLADCYDKTGDVLAAQDKLSEALDAYQQSLKLRQILAEGNKTATDWQRNLIVSLYKVGTTIAKIDADDNLNQAQELFRTALNLADQYSGPDRQQLIDNLTDALQKLVH